MAHAEQVDVAGFVQHGIDLGRWRTMPAQRYHLGGVLGRTRENRFDAAVAPVAHPSLQPARGRLGFDPGAIADALHAAADGDVEDGARFFHLAPVRPKTYARN